MKALAILALGAALGAAGLYHLCRRMAAEDPMTLIHIICGDHA